MPSYNSPKVEVRSSSLEGKGLFAKEAIKAGEIVVNFEGGLGEYIHTAEADKLCEDNNDHMIQVADDLWFAAVTSDDMEAGDFINHSCNPNCGIHGSLTIVAMRDIASNEEIAFDYAMSESSDYELACNCGAENCRKVITGNNWKLPALQARYHGFFSDYLQKKIDDSKTSA